MSNKEYRPTLAQIRTFVTIAEHRHFGTAASHLQISQPSLSQALVALESGLGIQLIERSTRKVIVTPVGERLLPYAQATLEAAESFVQHSRGAQGILNGQLTLGIIPTIAPYLLPESLRLAQERYPDLEPKVVEETTPALMEQLRNGQLDAALIAFPSGTTGLDEIPLYTEDFAIAVNENNGLAGRSDVALAELDALDMLLMDDGHCLRDQIMDLCRTANLDVAGMTESVTRASSLTTIIQLVAAGYGATLLPISAVPVECARPNVAVAHFADDVTASRDIGLVHRSSSTRTEDFTALGELIAEAFHATVDKRA